MTKMFPTRNHAGNLGEELQLNDAESLGIREFGGGSWGIPNRQRRVAFFDPHIVARAAKANTATEIALTGLDYFARELAGRKVYEKCEPVEDFIASRLSRDPSGRARGARFCHRRGAEGLAA